MSDVRRADVVSKFIGDACQVRPRPLHVRYLAFGQRIYWVSCRSTTAGHVPVVTGSAAEFFIDPALSCIGDLDIMHHRRDQLAFPRTGTAASEPRLRPSAGDQEEFSNDIDVYEMIDIDGRPGYVHLLEAGKFSRLRRSSSIDDNAEYVFIRTSPGYGQPVSLTPSVLVADRRIHGPAIVKRKVVNDASGSSFRTDAANLDNVFSIRCLEWPPQAANWPKRVAERRHGQPDIATVDRVVADGFDVIYFQKPDDDRSNSDWRMSFSRAEMTLLNGWTPKQQIVYHMLRYLAFYQDLTRDGVLTNYNLKTLVMWACELKPAHWWNRNSLIVICRMLLGRLHSWLIDVKKCQHYFIPECNLFSRHDCVALTSDVIAVGQRLHKLQLQGVGRLADWFFQRYVWRYVQLKCPFNVEQMFRDVNDDDVRYESAVSAALRYRLDVEAPMRRVSNYVNALFDLHALIRARSLDAVELPRSYYAELADFDRGFWKQFCAAACLHIVAAMERNVETERCLRVLAGLMRFDQSPMAADILSAITTNCSTTGLSTSSRVVGLRSSSSTRRSAVTSENVAISQPFNIIDDNGGQQLRRMLLHFVVECLTDVRRQMAFEFRSVGAFAVAVDDVRAMAAYVDGSYEECLRLVERCRPVDLLAPANLLPALEQSYFAALIDDDMASVFGLATVGRLHYCRRLDCAGEPVVVAADNLELRVVRQLALVLYVATQSRIRLRQGRRRIHEELRLVSLAIVKHRKRNDFLDSLLLTFVYRKAMRMLRLVHCQDKQS